MAHDDHFETVRIAWIWLHEGIFESDGSLRWVGKPEIGVLRSAAYNLFLLGMMKATSAAGIVHLDIHQYFSRLVHALLSMLPVVFGYKYLKEETDGETALAGGLILGLHFLMPFIAVRNLVETVSADLLFPALYFAHGSMKRGSDRTAFLAAVFGGLAFMVRMHVALALIAVPVVMILGRKWRQTIVFSGTLALMVVLQGLMDIWTHGQFLGSVFNYISGNLSQPPAVPAPWYRYIVLLFGIMIPPFSIVFILSIFSRKVIQNHAILWLALILFVIGHSVVVNKQERFIIPVFPMLIVLGCAGLYCLRQKGGPYFRWRKVRMALWGSFWLLNGIALFPFASNYAHRGTVDPMVYLSRQDDVGMVLFDMTERRRYLPYSYWDFRHENSVRLTPAFGLADALESGVISRSDPPSHIVIFSDGCPDRYLAALRADLGRYEVVHHGKPSIIDLIAYKFNPKYNRLNESWVLRHGT